MVSGEQTSSRQPQGLPPCTRGHSVIRFSTFEAALSGRALPNSRSPFATTQLRIQRSPVPAPSARPSNATKVAATCHRPRADSARYAYAQPARTWTWPVRPQNRSPPQRRALTSQPGWSLLDRRQQPSLITLRSPSLQREAVSPLTRCRPSISPSAAGLPARPRCVLGETGAISVRRRANRPCSDSLPAAARRADNVIPTPSPLLKQVPG